MITTTDPDLHLLMCNFRDKVHIEYVKPDFDQAAQLLRENTNPQVTVDYNHRHLKMKIILEV